MSADVIQLRDFQKPVPQPPELVEQVTGLVGFINALTARDGPTVDQLRAQNFNATLANWPYTETESYTAPGGDCA